MRLIIIRHGETIENAQGMVAGHLPGKLSKIGIEQNQKLAKRLKDEKIDIIYSSDLTRAADTAKEIAKYHPSTPTIYSKNLRERSFGKMDGKPLDIKDLSLTKIDCCESNDSLIKKTKEFLNKISSNKDKSILIIGHGGSIAAIVANLLNKSFDEIFQMGNINNGSITIFDPYPNLKLFNCTKHLSQNP